MDSNVDRTLVSTYDPLVTTYLLSYSSFNKTSS